MYRLLVLNTAQSRLPHVLDKSSLSDCYRSNYNSDLDVNKKNIIKHFDKENKIIYRQKVKELFVYIYYIYRTEGKTIESQK